MDKPRIFLGSSGKQARLLKSLTGGLATVADVEPWTTVFNPGITTLDRLVELTHEVDFAAFVFAQDDWTTATPATRDGSAGQARRATTSSSRPGCSAARWACAGRSSCTRTARSCPTDLLGLTCVRYDPTLTPHELKTVNQKLRKAIEDEGRLAAHRGRVVAVLDHGAHRATSRRP